MVISILGSSQIFAQDKRKIPKDFSSGKWEGHIQGSTGWTGKGGMAKYPFNVRLWILPRQITGVNGQAWLRLD